ncbi:hypothetical protein U9M48_044903 [Paspalum notatum var. saurae]|uniref:At1g61320/AtMIF1 LRR domain-containing protein n=1 Tax=Paspalum notatum var. saurae TaxID=547442 RepID=A0AAQ3XH68_PASNO
MSEQGPQDHSSVPQSLGARRTQGWSDEKHGHNPQGQKRRYSGPDLPEDILCLIHFLMPLRDAARTACVSHAFLCSWRSRPDITFSRATLGLNNNLHGKDEIAKDFNNKVDHILRNRSGIGLRTLKIEFCGYSADTYSYLNSWLEIAITQQLEELNLLMRPNKVKYSFPCSLLSKGSGNSIRHLGLAWCAFNTTVGLDCLKKLTSLHLCHVRITRDELGCLFSSSVTLEQLEFSNCHIIVCLKLPCLLQRLSSLRVFECRRLKRIQIKAPNISSFQFSGMQVELTVGESMQLKDMMLMMECTIPFACAKLPSIAPNLETLSLSANFKACTESLGA